MLVSAICRVNDVPKQHIFWSSEDYSLTVAPFMVVNRTKVNQTLVEWVLRPVLHHNKMLTDSSCAYRSRASDSNTARTCNYWPRCVEG